MSHLARWCFRHRFSVIAAWLLLLGLLGGLTAAVGTHFQDDVNLPHADSTTAAHILAAHFPDSATPTATVAWEAARPVTDPAVTSYTATLLRQLRTVPGIRRVTLGPIAADQHARTALLTLAPGTRTAAPATVTRLTQLITATNRHARADVHLHIGLGGDAVAVTPGTSFGLSEYVGLGVAAIVLLLAFGSLIAMSLPLLTSLIALGGALSSIALLSHLATLGSVAPSLTSLIGLGVGIDYALFVVTRYRTGLKAGLPSETAAVTAFATSGRAVTFAGITVCIALLGLFLTGVSFLYGLAVCAALGVLFTMAVTLTLLPALLGLAKTRVLSRRDRATLTATSTSLNDVPLAAASAAVEQLAAAARPRGWLAWSTRVQRHPWLWGVAALLIITTLAIPAFAMHLGTTDQGGDPPGSLTRSAYDIQATHYGPGTTSPIVITATLGTRPDPARAAFTDFQHTLTRDRHIAAVSAVQPSRDQRAALFSVVLRTGPTDTATNTYLRQLRTSVIPHAIEAAHRHQPLPGYGIHVGGRAALAADFATTLTARLPLVIAVVVGLSTLLLIAAFRSLLVPLLGAVMNLLAAAATYGVLVAVFQWGWGANLINVTRPGPIEAFLPVMLFAVLFGLSMDYQVFLVSRMHEEWVRTRDNAAAVRLGQADTGKIITAAAAIMVAVFASFIFGTQQVIAMFGLGLAVAIALDAFIIRTVLVPALLQLIGPRNWWLPTWLDRALPHINVDHIDPADDADDNTGSSTSDGISSPERDATVRSVRTAPSNSTPTARPVLPVFVNLDLPARRTTPTLSPTGHSVLGELAALDGLDDL